MDVCYVARQNAISASALELFQEHVSQFHELCNIFITGGVRTSISLPCQHALSHYLIPIQLFSSPNGLCSSITESKHIKAVKEPWHRSSHYKALPQILETLLRSEKMATLRRLFASQEMLKGTMASYMAGITYREDPQEDMTPLGPEHIFLKADEDVAPVDGICERKLCQLWYCRQQQV
jgi:hypothetical protein